MIRKVGCLVALLPLLVVLLVGGVIDNVTKGFAERTIADEITSRRHDVGKADVAIDSFPFLGRLLATGEIDSIDVRLSRLTGVGAPLDALDVRIEGLTIDRGTFVTDRKVELDSVDRATVTATVGVAKLEGLAGALGVVVQFRDDGTVVVGGVPLKVTATVAGNRVTVTVTGYPPVTVAVPVGEADLIPCQPTARVVSAGVQLTCTSDQIPKAVLAGLTAAATRGG